MSLGVVRQGDVCTGHGPFPPRPATQGSPNVFVNSMPAHRVGDSWASHCAGACHGGALAEGSGTVFVNGQPLGRLGDPVSCGSVAAQGSPNVFAG